MNLHAKFDVSSSNRFRDMEGSQNFKRRSRDPFTICKWEVAGDPIFGFLDLDLPTDYNFHGATMTIKGSLQVSIAIVKPFLRIFVPKFGWVTWPVNRGLSVTNRHIWLVLWLTNYLKITRWHGNNASQWKSGKIDPRSLKMPMSVTINRWNRNRKYNSNMADVHFLKSEVVITQRWTELFYRNLVFR